MLQNILDQMQLKVRIHLSKYHLKLNQNLVKMITIIITLTN